MFNVIKSRVILAKVWNSTLNPQKVHPTEVLEQHLISTEGREVGEHNMSNVRYRVSVSGQNIFQILFCRMSVLQGKKISEVKYVWELQCVTLPLQKSRMQITVSKNLKNSTVKGLLNFARLAFLKDLENKDRSLVFKRQSSLKSENNSVICMRESSAEIQFITNKMNHNARYELFKALKQ